MSEKLSDVVEKAIKPAFTLLPSRMRSREALVMLLAIGLQESLFKRRRQMANGPARGFWITKALLDTVPTIRDSADRQLFSIPGIVPESYDDIKGCRFADRCTHRRPECDNPQEDYEFGPEHIAKCVVMKEGGIPT